MRWKRKKVDGSVRRETGGILERRKGLKRDGRYRRVKEGVYKEVNSEGR